MSPALYNKLQGKKKDAKYDAIKNDYHQLGMTLLSLGNQDSVQDYYLPTGSVNNEKLGQHLGNFKRKYGSDHGFVSAVEGMVHPEDDHRNINFTPGHQ